VTIKMLLLGQQWYKSHNIILFQHTQLNFATFENVNHYFLLPDDGVHHYVLLLERWVYLSGGMDRLGVGWKST
jgi:hypothetical protein